jgi:transcriptional regulator with XRE-family HTH domain
MDRLQLNSHVGRKLRLRRRLLGLTLQDLARPCGTTLQQIHKYEDGSAAMGAARLWRVAQFLGVPVTYFFEGLGNPDAAHREERIETKEIEQLLNYAAGLPPFQRQRLIDLTIALADDEPTDPPSIRRPQQKSND